MKTAVVIIGVPGTGKSTLMRQIMGELDILTGETDGKFFKEGLVIGHTFGGVIVFGDYQNPDEVFPGLDRASMAIMPEFKQFIEKKQPQKILLEGDRLGSLSTIEFLLKEGYDLMIMILEADPSIVEERYKKRGSNQTDTFLNAKHTKVNNIRLNLDLQMDGYIFEVKNNTQEDLQENTQKVLAFLK